MGTTLTGAKIQSFTVSDKLHIINFGEEHPISQSYKRTLQRTQLPTTHYALFGNMDESPLNFERIQYLNTFHRLIYFTVVSSETDFLIQNMNLFHTSFA